ncbi:hypothetical protein HDV05_004406 [Chytridiales sp. JEL 0842]|nr:hypothetical protein HDV05_004406 [Chytridiales sp. JEL 0842]
MSFNSLFNQPQQRQQRTPQTTGQAVATLLAGGAGTALAGPAAGAAAATVTAGLKDMLSDPKKVLDGIKKVMAGLGKLFSICPVGLDRNLKQARNKNDLMSIIDKVPKPLPKEIDRLRQAFNHGVHGDFSNIHSIVPNILKIMDDKNQPQVRQEVSNHINTVLLNETKELEKQQAVQQNSFANLLQEASSGRGLRAR